MSRNQLLEHVLVLPFDSDVSRGSYLAAAEVDVDELFARVAADLASLEQVEFAAAIQQAILDHLQLVRLCGGQRVSALELLGQIGRRILQILAGDPGPSDGQPRVPRLQATKPPGGGCRIPARGPAGGTRCNRGFFSSTKVNLRNAP